MQRVSSRTTAGISNRYLSGEYVLATFMKGKKHAVMPATSININPLDTNKAEIKICGKSTSLTIVSKGTKAQMNMDKTKFARETGSEEVDLGQFVDDEEEREENEICDGFDSPVRNRQSHKSISSKEHSTFNVSEIYSSSPSSTTFKPSNKPSNTTKHFDLVYNSSTTSSKRRRSSDSSFNGNEVSDDDNDEDEEEVLQAVRRKRSDIKDDTGMLNKLLSRKKMPQKKKKKTTAITDENEVISECHGCAALRNQVDDLHKRLRRVEVVIPTVKQFCPKKNVGLDPAVTTTNMPPPKIQEINESIKKIFGIDPNVVDSPRDRPTLAIRKLFTVSNHVHDYSKYLTENAELLKFFIQYRCPGIIDMNQTWYEISKSMATLHGDIKKNATTKQNRLAAKTRQSQQLVADSVPTNITASTQDDNVENELLE